MWFTNNGGPVKIRIGEPNGCHWRTIKKRESVDLSAEMGLHYGFSIKTTEGQIGNKKVETKQIEIPKLQVHQKHDQNDFFKELCSIKGIGSKTAKDIIRIFPNREDLKNKIHNNENLPLRDDIAKLLEDKYG